MKQKWCNVLFIKIRLNFFFYQGLFKCLFNYHLTSLFTRLEELSLAPAGFLTAQSSFCRKPRLWSFGIDERTKMKFIFISSMEKKKREDKSIHHPIHPILPFSSRQAGKRSTTQFQNNGFINYIFWRKLAVRNSSSLVNKQVAFI